MYTKLLPLDEIGQPQVTRRHLAPGVIEAAHVLAYRARLLQCRRTAAIILASFLTFLTVQHITNVNQYVFIGQQLLYQYFASQMLTHKCSLAYRCKSLCRPSRLCLAFEID